MTSVQGKIHNRIKRKGRGAVFTSKDFLDLGSRASVDQALSRLTRDGAIARLRRGVYHFPRTHPGVGNLSPDDGAVAQALVGDAPLQVTGASAANALGLTTQVPAKAIFYSDRSHRDVPIGRRSISIRKGSARQLAGAGRPCGPVIQALRYLGRDGVNDRVVHALRGRLSPKVRRDLLDYVQTHPHRIPDWMRQPVQQIASGAK